MLLLLLSVLRLLRILPRTAAATAAVAAAVCCHFWKSVSRRRQIITMKSNEPAGRVLSPRPLELGFESTWGRVLVLFLPLPTIKIHTILFRVSDLVICGLWEWSDSVRTAAAAVVIMYPFTAPHVLLYSSTINSTINIVLFTAAGRQMRGSSPLFDVFFAFFFFHFFCFFCMNGCLSNVLFTAAVWLQKIGFEPSLFPLLCFFSPCFPFFFFRWVRGINYCCRSYPSILHSIPNIYLFLAF